MKLHTSIQYHNYLIPSNTVGEIISNGTDYIRWELESNYYIFHDIFTSIMEYRTSNIILEENKEIVNTMLMFLYSYIHLSPVYIIIYYFYILLIFFNRNYLMNVLKKYIQILQFDMRYMINIFSCY